MQNENTKVDPSEAPEGFIAVASEAFTCFGCCLESGPNCYLYHCTPSVRKDGRYVHFLKKEDHKATISYPCGSLGEEIEN